MPWTQAEGTRPPPSCLTQRKGLNFVDRGRIDERGDSMVGDVAAAHPQAALRGGVRMATTRRQSRYPLGGTA